MNYNVFKQGGSTVIKAAGKPVFLGNATAHINEAATGIAGDVFIQNVDRKSESWSINYSNLLNADGDQVIDNAVDVNQVVLDYITEHVNFNSTSGGSEVTLSAANQEITDFTRTIKTKTSDASSDLAIQNASGVDIAVFQGGKYTSFSGVTLFSSNVEIRGVRYISGNLDMRTSVPGATKAFVINKNYGGSASQSALFQVNSNTTQATLLTRHTTAEFNAIPSKAQGLETFSTDDNAKLWFDGTRTVGFRYNGTKFQGYNGITWVDLN